MRNSLFIMLALKIYIPVGTNVLLRIYIRMMMLCTEIINQQETQTSFFITKMLLVS
jgi:hypothetical protein